MAKENGITKAQRAVLDDILRAYQRIRREDGAIISFDEYFNNYLCAGMRYHNIKEAEEMHVKCWGREDWETNVAFYKQVFEDNTNNIFLVQASSNTLRALERLGIIEIIDDGRRLIDKVRLTEHGLELVTK